MDFDGAIAAHSEWKTKLRAYLGKHDGSLSPATVGVDNLCALGKWLIGEGAKHSTLLDFAVLKAEHAKFHRCAGEIVTQINAGNFSKAETLLGAASEYTKSSTNVVTAIQRMRKAVGG